MCAGKQGSVQGSQNSAFAALTCQRLLGIAKKIVVSRAVELLRVVFNDLVKNLYFIQIGM